MATKYGIDVEQCKKTYEKEEDRKRLKDDLLFPAVLDFIYENAKK